mmetsp:Transcript_11836/g.17743  ORF Transcript_11836/g.17743 Transcript_11836/m.17743 type:complete len:269 (-) Transcript_11836:227-1033(-)
MTCSGNRFVLTVVSTALLAMVSNVQAFTLTPLTQVNTRSTTAHCTQIHAQKDNRPMEMDNIKKGMASLLVASTICLSTLNINSPAACAYDDYTYSDTNDVDTVEKVVKSLKDASGDAAASFKAFESISEIITEGKGVGGMISSSGVRLERGFVADEDTTIYNPGLSLLTESEKDKIVNAVIENRKENAAKKTWSKDNEFAFDFLKTKLDPLHMAEIKGYLGILPIYGAVVYLGAIAVQQIARDLFETAYVVSAVAIFLPALVLIIKGV